MTLRATTRVPCRSRSPGDRIADQWPRTIPPSPCAWSCRSPRAAAPTSSPASSRASSPSGWANSSRSTTAPAPAGRSAPRSCSMPPADGYTLLVVSMAHAVNPHLYKLKYDMTKDFVPVAMFGTGGECARRAPLGARQQRQGTPRPRQGQARLDQHRPRRRRQLPASGGRELRPHGQDQDRRSAVQGRRPGPGRCARRPSPGADQRADLRRCRMSSPASCAASPRPA